MEPTSLRYENTGKMQGSRQEGKHNTSVHSVVRTDLPSGEDTGGDLTFLRTAALRLGSILIFQSKIVACSPDCTAPEDPHRLSLVCVELHAAKKACFSQD